LVAGSLSVCLLSEGDESESSGAASLSIENNVGLLNLAELSESLQNIKRLSDRVQQRIVELGCTSRRLSLSIAHGRPPTNSFNSSSACMEMLDTAALRMET
jgi:hypothetical protein